jgi:hypothetical protein
MNRSLFLALTFVFGCDAASTGGNANDPIPSTPTQASDVGSVYQQIGNSCNGGELTRTLTAVSGLDPNNLWDAPAADYASLAAPKRDSGWGAIVAVGELTFDGFSDNMTSTSEAQAQRCGGARELFTPYTRDDRSYSMNLLLYAGEHAHVEQFPASGFVPDPLDAPVRLRGYIDVSSGVREDLPSGVLYSEVTQQHIPISIACEKPLRVLRFFQSVQADQIADIDLSTCSKRPNDDFYLCLFERFEHVADNRCTFVATNATYRTPDGTQLRLSLGGRLETRSASEPIQYKLTVDRYAFHAARE